MSMFWKTYKHDSTAVTPLRFGKMFINWLIEKV